MSDIPETQAKNTGRDAKGRWQKGISGGSNGGRKKAEFRFQDILDAKIPEERWGDIVEAQVQKALNGDTAAAKLLIERRFGEAPDPGDKEALDRFFAFIAGRR